MIRGLYAIADVETLAKRGVGLREFAEGLRAAGVSVVQLRDKSGSPQAVLAGAEVLREVFRGTGCLLVMNDRVDLGVIAGFGGVHLGQEDLAVEDVRVVVERQAKDEHRGHGGRTEDSQRGFVVGVSTHTEEQVRVADLGAADYLAIGPVFATGTKADAAAVVGLEGVRRARALTAKQLVAIGGITRENARSVVEAGADAVAVISGLLVEGESVEKVARDFMAIFG
jgi:thiamine-phosphate pyrophosphorylase